MNRFSSVLIVAASLGVILGWPRSASASCRHGLVYGCRWCGGSSGYAYATAGTPMMMLGAVGMATPGATSAGGTARPPAFVPMLPYPGAGASHFGYAQMAHAPTALPGTISSASSVLSGYDPSAPIAPVSPGTVLSNGHLFGSHIYQVLRQFGAGLERSGLIDVAIRAFLDASGVIPNSTDRAILEQIVGRFERTNGSLEAEHASAGVGSGTTTSGTTTSTSGTATTGANVIRIVITIEAPPETQIQTATNKPGTPSSSKTERAGGCTGSTATSNSATSGTGNTNPIGNSEPPVAPR